MSSCTSTTTLRTGPFANSCWRLEQGRIKAPVHPDHGRRLVATHQGGQLAGLTRVETGRFFHKSRHPRPNASGCHGGDLQHTDQHKDRIGPVALEQFDMGGKTPGNGKAISCLLQGLRLLFDQGNQRGFGQVPQNRQVLLGDMAAADHRHFQRVFIGQRTPALGSDVYPDRLRLSVFPCASPAQRRLRRLPSRRIQRYLQHIRSWQFLGVPAWGMSTRLAYSILFDFTFVHFYP